MQVIRKFLPSKQNILITHVFITQVQKSETLKCKHTTQHVQLLQLLPLLLPLAPPTPASTCTNLEALRSRPTPTRTRYTPTTTANNTHNSSSRCVKASKSDVIFVG